MFNKGSFTGYERWTNYETAETGVRYSDEYGEWVRTSFTSREDNVSITKLTSSSAGAKIHLTLSIDDISALSGAYAGPNDLKALQYKKLADSNADYLAQVVHYPSYPGSELAYGGYAGLTRIVVVNGIKEKVVLDDSTLEPMNVSGTVNPAVQVKDADEVYFITRSRRTHSMGRIEDFAAMTQYDIIDQLFQDTNAVVRKYSGLGGQFDYDAALAAHTEKHSAEYSAVSFSIEGDEQDKDADNPALIRAQQSAPQRVNHAFMEQVYNQGRYAMICCSGASAPRLYGMWTGEWNPGWRGIYTLDANVNLQVAAMNTGHLTQAQLGYITFS